MAKKSKNLDDVLVKPRRWPFLLWLLACIPFAAGSIFMGYDALQSDNDIWEKARLVALSAFFPLLLILVFRRMLNRSAVLLIKLDGLVVYPESDTPIEVRWQDVSGLQGHRVRYQKFLGIDVHDRTALLERSGAGEKGVARLLGKLRFSDFEVPLFGTGTDPENLIKLIQERVGFLKAAARQQMASQRVETDVASVGE